MRIIGIIVCFLAFLTLKSQATFEVDTIFYNGDPSTKINLVFLGDGYLAEDLDQFVSDAERFGAYLFSIEPFKSYHNYFNSFAIKVPSEERGANHPGTATDVTEPVIPVKNVNTFFNSTFDYFEIHRLLVSQNTSKVLTTLAANFPSYDQPILLVNSQEYGGSGGFVSTSSLSSDAAEVVVHEMGHSFANLSDEYYAGDQYSGESRNMTQITDPESVKWKNWYGDKGVGIYQHCCSETAMNWYRPHQDCKMRYLGVPFCSICQEAIIERIHDFVSPLISFSPGTTDTAQILEELRFAVELVNPNPNTLKRTWMLNGSRVAIDSDTLQLEFQQLEAGPNVVSVTIADTTSLLRVGKHSNIHSELVIWQFENITTATVDLNIEGERYQVSIYPNPSDDFINISLASDHSMDASIRMYDIMGNQVCNQVFKSNETLLLPVAHLSSGLYFLRLHISGRLVYSEKLFIGQ